MGRLVFREMQNLEEMPTLGKVSVCVHVYECVCVTVYVCMCTYVYVCVCECVHV